MTALTPQNRSLVLAEVQKQPYATRFAKEEINQALASAVEIFSDFEQVFAPGFCHVLLRSAGGQRPTDFALELIPALVYAHRFFADSFPKGLKEKLRNQPQTHDTLLELWCLGSVRTTSQGSIRAETGGREGPRSNAVVVSRTNRIRRV
jgi:hypothetical protein